MQSASTGSHFCTVYTEGIGAAHITRTGRYIGRAQKAPDSARYAGGGAESALIYSPWVPLRDRLQWMRGALCGHDRKQRKTKTPPAPPGAGPSGQGAPYAGRGRRGIQLCLYEKIGGGSGSSAT